VPRRTVRIALLVLLAAFSSIAVLLVAGFVAGLRTGPRMRAEAERYDREGTTIATIDPEWKRILLAVEDPGFYEHTGIDLSTPGAGLTTITQGLAKRYCFDRFRPGAVAKVRQTLCALGIDRRVPKDEQLTLLLNVASLGPGGEGWVEGFPAAAREYFGKPFDALSTDEFTVLVAMLVGPATYHPTQGREALDERVRRIRRLLDGVCAPAGAGTCCSPAAAEAIGRASGTRPRRAPRGSRSDTSRPREPRGSAPRLRRSPA
jgi:hypothetical protein